MKRILCTFGGANYDVTTREIFCSGIPNKIFIYDDLWLTQQPFYERNQWLWQHSHKRGFGWYAFKPYIILDALSRCDNGDVVMFIDADTVPVADYSVLYDTCIKEDVMLFEASGRVQWHWCKRDCYIVMGQDEPAYQTCQAGVARFMLFKKGPYHVQQFLWEWLTYCVNPLCNTFDPSVLGPELPGFVEHRCEQAILTNLAHKYRYRLYREADQHGNPYSHDKELYGQLFEQRPATEYLNVTAPVLGSRYRNV